MIFVDSNVPMYLVGADHPNKARSRETLTRLILARERLVTSAEAFQEILHRYTSIRRREAIRPAWEALMGIVHEVLPVDLDDVEQARDLLVERTTLSARDALHAATMRRHGIDRVLSFDGGFDVMPGITRIA